jgi:hypothetical protein
MFLNRLIGLDPGTPRGVLFNLPPFVTPLPFAGKTVFHERLRQLPSSHGPDYLNDLYSLGSLTSCVYSISFISCL